MKEKNEVVTTCSHDLEIDDNSSQLERTESEVMKQHLKEKYNTKETHEQLRMKGLAYLGVKKR
jgi:hypothetical protein